MDISYKELNADITPEVLGSISNRKILFESSNGNKNKNRYSILAFETYGEIYLNNRRLLIETENQTQKYIDNYFAEVNFANLEHLPFISGFIDSFSFDIVRHAYPKLNNIKLEDT